MFVLANIVAIVVKECIIWGLTSNNQKIEPTVAKNIQEHLEIITNSLWIEPTGHSVKILWLRTVARKNINEGLRGGGVATNKNQK